MTPVEYSRRPRWQVMLWTALWVCAAVPVAVLASVPTSTQVQAVLGLAVLAVVVLLKPLSRRWMAARVTLLAAAGLLVLRYWIWRITETLPGYDEPASFAAALLLLAVETYAVAVFFLTAFINADPINRQPPPRVALSDLPKVDILIPSYNELPEMLGITLSAAKNIHYPKDRLTVVLCDDGGTDARCAHADPAIAEASQARRATLQALCRDLGVRYNTRARNEHAKAGNMSAALDHLDGDLVVVFDADHVPSGDFLARTAGYFVENPRLFLVQTPHYFLNADPIERNVGLAANCPTENEMFYADIHRGLDRWGGAFFCGSAAVLRRAALDEVGGFSGETITEDAETALDIHARGWESMYIDRAMIAGLQPETFATFIQQRGRWATGMIQMLLLKNPLFRPGLGLAQRLCYLNSMSFWLFPLVRMTFLVMPLFYLFFGLEIFVATGPEVLAYTLSYLVVSVLTQNALFARVRWPLISELYEIAQAPYLAVQICKTMLRPRAATFAVTAKDEVLNEDHISPIALPLVLLVVLLALGVIAAALRWTAFPGDRAVVEIVGAWAVFNFLLAGLSLASVTERQQRRSLPRVEMQVPATLHPEDGTGPGFAAMVCDASMSGARVMISRAAHAKPETEELAALSPGARLRLRPVFPQAPHLQTDILCDLLSVSRGGGGAVFGLRFAEDQSADGLEAIAYLIFGSSEPWRLRRAARETERGLVSGLVYVTGLALRTLPQTLFTLLRTSWSNPRAAVPEAEARAPVNLLAFDTDEESVLWPEQTQIPAGDTGDRKRRSA